MSIAHTLILFLFFFNDTATTEIYTLSLHDALPISTGVGTGSTFANAKPSSPSRLCSSSCVAVMILRENVSPGRTRSSRSEEHTSELQSHLNLVCRLLLEKKKK